MKKPLGYVPFSPTDLANKGYVDNRALWGNTPPSGGWWQPLNLVTAAGATGMTQNTVYFTKFLIEGGSYTIQALGVQVTAVASGGSGLTFNIGIYYDKGDGSGPLLSTGPITQGPVDITTASSTIPRSFAVTQVLSPGLYWVATRYGYTTAPSTAPTISCISTGITLWQANNSSLGSSRYLSLSGQSAFPTSDLNLTPGGGSNCPSPGIQRA